ncbi:RNA-directed DNA polymerase (reverse transcriptase)-related family protein [Rhynchospora pubera]|uniref:RNA-directed DNA polymerase (Reverse transcriptase)-related family protein n=1 Tax=Rhynchospora pubera TaxID=906938 RepID=A0AAV8GEI5_9POAL|nr:RNA-directed DNA polymerase (reverse transcriptase)-related family protein [Rhynchospora pubera]
MQAQTQLFILKHQLQDPTFLPSGHLQDQICCKLTPNCLTSSSLYKFMKTMPKIPSNLNHLWKLHLPPRIKTFCWLLLQNKIPTIDNLQKRGMTIVNRCCLCLSDAESVAHTFTLCPFFLAVVNNTLYLTNTTYCRPPCYHIDDLTSKSLTLCQKEIMAFSCYFTWRERCSRTFSNRASQPNNIASLIIEEWRLLNPD